MFLCPLRRLDLCDILSLSLSDDVSWCLASSDSIGDMSPTLVLLLVLMLLALLPEPTREKGSSTLFGTRVEPRVCVLTVILCDFCTDLNGASGDNGEDIDSLVDTDEDGNVVSVSDDNDDVDDDDDGGTLGNLELFGCSEPFDSVRFRCVDTGFIGAKGFDTDLLRTRLGLETNLFIFGKIVGKCFWVAKDLRVDWFCIGVRCGCCGGDDNGREDVDDEKEDSVE